MIMRKLFFLSLISTFLSPIHAETFCTLISEKEPDVNITMNYPSGGYGYGTMNYKNKPVYYFEIGISNGYGTQYYQLKTYSPDAVSYDPKVKYFLAPFVSCSLKYPALIANWSLYQYSDPIEIFISLISSLNPPGASLND